VIYPANYTILNNDTPLGALCAYCKWLPLKNACSLISKPIDVIITWLLLDKMAGQGFMIITAEYSLFKFHAIRFICALFKGDNIHFKKRCPHDS